MKQVTRWSPDTCDCVLEYEWDDEKEPRTHTFKKAINLCEHHKRLGEANAYEAVLSENSAKNLTFTLAQEIKPELEVVDYTWSFDKERKLKVGFLGKMNDSEISRLKDRLRGDNRTAGVEVI